VQYGVPCICGYVYTTDNVAIDDIHVQSGLENNYQDGTFKLTVTLRNTAAQDVDNYQLNIQLLDGEKIIFQENLQITHHTHRQ